MGGGCIGQRSVVPTVCGVSWKERRHLPRGEATEPKSAGQQPRFAPGIREVDSPLTKEMLAPLEAQCRARRSSTRCCATTNSSTHADLLRARSDVTLRAYGSYDGSISDLTFLRFFP